MFLSFAILTGLSISGVRDINPSIWEGRVAAGQSLEIKNTYGSIHAEPALGEQAEVSVEPPDLRVIITQNEHGITFQAVPAGEPDREVRADFTVRVPRGVRFVGRTVNGSVHVDSLRGDAAAYTVNGDVRISAAGETQAETVNGSITASLGRMCPGHNLKFSSVNGGITLHVRKQLSAKLRVTTLNGGIVSEFPISLQRRGTGGSAEVTLGRGGPELKLVTVNGTIKLRRTAGV
jgi:hypothetical protein